MTHRYTLHVLYEYGPDWRPHGSTYIRLWRPLSHPALRDALKVTFAKDYHDEPVDAVLLDRLWRPDVTLELVERLSEQVRGRGTRFIYAVDDDFLTLDTRRAPWFTEEHREVVRFLLQEADIVLVTTPELKRRFASHNKHIVVLRNGLDERLLVGGGGSPLGERRIVIGYMGTKTHDDDLLLVLPALQTVAERHSGRVAFQIVGGVEHTDTWAALRKLPLHVLQPAPSEAEYPLFMLWFTGRIQWDIALAPLDDVDFNACKSDIKFLDYCAAGAAGIYSRVPAYANSVIHRETGLLVGNDLVAWRAALETLLEDAMLRQRLANNAQRYLYRERVLAKQVMDWLEVLV